jgi:hypothetical protein
MHARVARLTGPVKSAAAMAVEIMILLNIDFRIAQVRPPVEESVQCLCVLVVFFWRTVPRAVPQRITGEMFRPLR